MEIYLKILAIVVVTAFVGCFVIMLVWVAREMIKDMLE